MIASGSPVASDFENLVDRLSRASSRPKVPWSVALRADDWNDESRDALSSLPYWDPLSNAEPYLALSEEDRREFALQRALSFYSVGIGLERILRVGFTKLADTLHPDDPALRYIAYELVEEAEHSAMFQWFIDLAGPGNLPHTSISEDEIVRIADLGADNPAIFLLYVVCGEMLFDRVQRVSLTARSTPSLIARINRIHCIEEARHVSFGRALLRQYLASAGSKLIRRMTYEAPLVANWTSAKVIDSPRSLYETIGASEDSKPATRYVIRRSELHQRCMRDLYRFCRGLGLVDDRLSDTWRSTINCEDD